jgi:osmotically-inducible protein OsmY
MIPTVLVAVMVASLPAMAQQDGQNEALLRAANKIRKEILTLPDYGVFDWITFSMGQGANGFRVVLKGSASRPTLKNAAEQVTKKVEGVSEVANEIEVLPLSRVDEDARMKVYAAIYFHPTLSRYNPGRGTPMYGARRTAQLGISNNPPMGYHPISIIVKNGNVTLEGSVDNDMDKQIAGMQANTVGGVFSVTNNLTALQPSKKKEKK